jgi:integrase
MPRQREGTAWRDPRDGRWIIRFPLADGSPSKPIKLDPEVTTKDEAKANAFKYMKRAAKEGRTRATILPSGKIVPGETFAAWSERWLKVICEHGNPRDARDKGGHFTKWLRPALGRKPMVAITKAELEAWVEWIDAEVRAGKLSAKTAANAFGTLTRSFAEASASKVRALRVRDDNPAHGVRGPDEGVRKSKTYLYPSEFLALVAHPRIPIRWRRLFALGVYTYARTGELEALEREDVDLEHRRIHIHRAIERVGGEVKETKTNRPRRIPIEPNLVPLLEALERDGKGPHVIDMPPACDLSKRLRQYLEWAGVTRAELFANDATRKQIGFYDATRATGIRCDPTPDSVFRHVAVSSWREAQTTPNASSWTKSTSWSGRPTCKTSSTATWAYSFAARASRGLSSSTSTS